LLRDAFWLKAQLVCGCDCCATHSGWRRVCPARTRKCP